MTKRKCSETITLRHTGTSTDRFAHWILQDKFFDHHKDARKIHYWSQFSSWKIQFSRLLTSGKLQNTLSDTETSLASKLFQTEQKAKNSVEFTLFKFFQVNSEFIALGNKLLLRSIGEPGEFWTYSSSLSVLLCFFQLGRKLNSANFLGQEGSLAGSTGSSSLAWLPRLAPKVSTKSCCTLGYRGSPPLVRSSLVRILLFEL